MKKFIIGIGLIVAVGIGYYLISPLFRTVVVDDPVPVIENKSEVTAVDEGMNAEQVDSPTVIEQEDVIEQVEEVQVETVSNIQTYQIVETSGHPASGQVRVLETGESTIIRYEDFSTINGPNLHVYLANDLEAQDFVDLGPIRGTEGNINYEVPADIDVSDYQYVMYWCVPFGVLFNYAELDL